MASVEVATPTILISLAARTIRPPPLSNVLSVRGAPDTAMFRDDSTARVGFVGVRKVCAYSPRSKASWVIHDFKEFPTLFQMTYPELAPIPLTSKTVACPPPLLVVVPPRLELGSSASSSFRSQASPSMQLKPVVKTVAIVGSATAITTTAAAAAAAAVAAAQKSRATLRATTPNIPRKGNPVTADRDLIRNPVLRKENYRDVHSKQVLAQDGKHVLYMGEKRNPPGEPTSHWEQLEQVLMKTPGYIEPKQELREDVTQSSYQDAYGKNGMEGVMQLYGLNGKSVFQPTLYSDALPTSGTYLNHHFERGDSTQTAVQGSVQGGSRGKAKAKGLRAAKGPEDNLQTSAREMAQNLSQLPVRHQPYCGVPGGGASAPVSARVSRQAYAQLRSAYLYRGRNTAPQTARAATSHRSFRATTGRPGTGAAAGAGAGGAGAAAGGDGHIGNFQGSRTFTSGDLAASRQPKAPTSPRPSTVDSETRFQKHMRAAREAQLFATEPGR